MWGIDNYNNHDHTMSMGIFCLYSALWLCAHSHRICVYVGGRIYWSTYFLLSHKFYCVLNKRIEKFPKIPIIHFTPYIAFRYQMGHKESTFSLDLWIGKKCSKGFSVRYRALRKWVLPSVNPQTCKLPKWEIQTFVFLPWNASSVYHGEELVFLEP